jgi:hypothetical protein
VVTFFLFLQDELHRSVAAVTLLELARRAPEKLRLFYKEAVPTIFIGRFDPLEENAKLFNDVWNESSIGSINNYIEEVCSFLVSFSLFSLLNPLSLFLFLFQVLSLIRRNMEGQSWTLKLQAALALKEAAEKGSDELGKQVSTVLALIVSFLPGRTDQKQFKQALLSALSATCRTYRTEIESGLLCHVGYLFFNPLFPAVGRAGKSPRELVELCLKEVSKKDKDYKRAALASLASLLQTFCDGTRDNVLDVWELVYPQLILCTADEPM